MSQNYTPEFRKKIVRLHEEEGRTYKSITAEYGVSRASIAKWCKNFREECQNKALLNPDAPNELDLMKENLRVLFEGNRLEAYRFIEKHHAYFGLRWLLRRLDICPNAYYNYRKHRKAGYY